jgi:hypothetical protein
MCVRARQSGHSTFACRLQKAGGQKKTASEDAVFFQHETPEADAQG